MWKDEPTATRERGRRETAKNPEAKRDEDKGGEDHPIHKAINSPTK